jgi:hypothetical protein
MLTSRQATRPTARSDAVNVAAHDCEMLKME